MALPVRVGITVLMLLLGVGCAELFLRVLMPWEIFFETWFSPGVHTPDDRFGFVYTPYYDGVIYSDDRVWAVPTKLDKYGFRIPARNFATTPGRQVILLGGASMTFCVGLPDYDTLAASLARELRDPVTVTCTSWPGFSLPMNLDVFRTLVGKDIQTDVMILCVHKDPRGEFPYSSVASPDAVRPDAHRFRLINGVSTPASKLTSQIPMELTKSYVAYGMVNSLDEFLTFMKRSTRVVQASLTRSAPSSEPTKDLSEFSEFLADLDTSLARDGAKLLVAFLPSLRESIPPDVVAAVPRGIPMMDLHAELRPKLQTSDFIADGHYSKKITGMMAHELATRVDALLAETPAK